MRYKYRLEVLGECGGDEPTVYEVESEDPIGHHLLQVAAMFLDFGVLHTDVDYYLPTAQMYVQVTEEDDLICPFCGEKAIVDRATITVGQLGYYVRCDNDECAVKPESVAVAREADALAQWNNR